MPVKAYDSHLTRIMFMQITFVGYKGCPIQISACIKMQVLTTVAPVRIADWRMVKGIP
jgi:hypothetical protein